MAVREEPNFSNIEQHFSSYRPSRREARRAAAQAESAAHAGRDLPWNVLTVLVWLATAFLVMAFLSIYRNPESALNPLRVTYPPTIVAAVFIPTMTPSPQPTAVLVEETTPEPEVLEPTLTATPTSAPTETATPGPSPTATIHSVFPFTQRGEIKVIDAATFPDHDSCRMWVAGQAYDLQGAPMVGITVMMGGVLDFKSFNQLSLTGTALQYGQAGYEFTLSEQPVRSRQSVWVQLFDQSMMPLSARVFFDTSDDCAQNLILVNFRQVR